MKHIIKKYIPSKEVVEEHEVSSCIKCNSQNIFISEYEDQYGFISTALCKNCKTELKDNTTEEGIIKLWNEKNDIDTVISTKTNLIEKLKIEIKELKKLKTLRRRTKNDNRASKTRE